MLKKLGRKWEFFKQVIAVTFDKETREMKEDKLRHKTLYELCQVFCTGQDDPFSHLSEVTTMLERFERGEATEVKFRNDLLATFQLTSGHVMVIAECDHIFIPSVAELMMTWVGLYRKKLDRSK